MSEINLRPIGTIHSPFSNLEGMPVQPSAAKGIKGKIILEEDYLEGLADLDGFSHLYLLYHFHLSNSYHLKVKPFLDHQQRERGLFATRAPKRPNPIGLSTVKLLKIERNILEIENVDVIDGTPLLDIKPYILEMDAVNEYRTGWLSENIKQIDSKMSDNRFKDNL